MFPFSTANAIVLKISDNYLESSMAWNEPGGDKDPWSGNKKQGSPPDLDKVFRDFQKKVTGMLGGKKLGSAGGAGNGESGVVMLTSILVIVLAIWAVFGFYIVSPSEKAVVLRFGAYSRTVDPGLHWLPPIIERKFAVNVKATSQNTYDADMLTSDENIVSVKIAVQYVSENPEKYLFNIVNPIESLEQVSASALRQVIGDNNLDYILTEGKDEITSEIFSQVNELQEKYQSGIRVTNVSLLSAKPPEAVADAFDDVIKSREDMERYVDQAKAYAAKVVPEAEGRALRSLADAEAYQQNMVLNARGETARFAKLLPEYHRTPRVTRERMYLSAIELVFKNTSKVLVDVQSSNNLMYIPLDKILGGQSPLVVNETQNVTEAPVIPGAKGSSVASRQSNSNSYLNIANRERSSRGRGTQ